MSNGKQIKLSKRLQQIDAMVTTTYDHIWDCCCDHGLLGAALLARQAAPHIHFVDIVPELMGELKNKLIRFYPKKPKEQAQWQVHCMDVSTLPLQQFTGKHLVIIAGVGGALMAELVKEIYQKNPTVDMDFLLCPVLHQFTLRQLLIQLDFSLLNEMLMVENHRFYEMLLVSTGANARHPHTAISPTGSLFWHSSNPEQTKIAANYLTKVLAHYRRVQLNSAADVQHIIDAYSAIAL